MIAFLTLFLGLVAGVHPVAVSVNGPVAAVEMELDGAPAGRSTAAPWSVPVNFGSDLAPHELVARAIGADGQEIGRVRQWLNLPRPAAEVQILLQRNDKGVIAGARLTWESLFSEAPKELAVSFDGRPVAVQGGEPFTLPAYDASTTHLLSATAGFPKGLRGRADAVIGGRSSSQASSELTAIPVRIPESQGQLDVSTFEGAFVRGGAALRPIAVERGPAEILIVRGLSSSESIQHLGRGGRAIFDQQRRGSMPPYDPEALRLEMRMGDLDRLSFLWPVAQTIAGRDGQNELFAGSRIFFGREMGLHWLLTRVSHPGAPGPDPRFADAAAIAGLHAVESCTRRAVVLVLGRKANDVSRHTAASVRAYLERVRVPLYVWSFDPAAQSPGAPWGPVEDITNVAKLKVAVANLRRDLDSQAIVWVEGKYLPQQIESSDALRKKGIEIVTGASR